MDPSAPGVGGDVPHRLLDGAPDDVDADPLIALELEALERLAATHERDAAAGHDALLDRRLRRVHGILDARLLLLHLGFGGCTDLDDGDAADELRQPLLQLLTVVVRGRVLDLRPDLLDATFDGRRRAAAFDDGGVVLVDGDLLGLAEILELDVLELDAEVFGDGAAAGEDRDVFEHRLPAIAETRRLHRCGLQRPAKLVHDQRRQRFALDVFRHDQRAAGRAAPPARARAAGPSSS